MNDKEKTAVAFAVGIVIITTVNYIKIIHDERRKRIAIEAETKLQIQAMRVASKRVKDRIHRDGFDRLTLQNIMTDYEFETIVERFEK